MRFPASRPVRAALLAATLALGVSCTAPALEVAPKPVVPPYTLERALARAEELFSKDNYREAAVFYYEALALAEAGETVGRIHFRVGECLEAMRRFEYAGYHYKLALKSPLPEVLASRALTKLQHLPKLAQKEEATRLFKRARANHKARNVRAALDDYIESIRLEPGLMSQDDGGLIDDAIQYLTYLSESPDKEPQRLLKLATFLELRGEADKAKEVYKQIQVLFRGTPEATLAKDKVHFFEQRRNRFIEPRRPENALDQVVPQQTPIIVDARFEFSDPGTVSKESDGAAYTFRAANEQANLPARRFEVFTAILGAGENQKELQWRAADGEPESRESTHEDGNLVYTLTLENFEIVTAYVNDVYGEGMRAQPLFTNVKVHLVVRRR